MIFLLDAYRKLIDASEREYLGPQRRDNLESALADNMLLGGAREIEAAGRFQFEVAEGFRPGSIGQEKKPISLIPVIEALRSSLRDELELPEVALPERFNLRLQLDSDPRT